MTDLKGSVKHNGHEETLTDDRSQNSISDLAIKEMRRLFWDYVRTDLTSLQLILLGQEGGERAGDSWRISFDYLDKGEADWTIRVKATGPDGDQSEYDFLVGFDVKDNSLKIALRAHGKRGWKGFELLDLYNEEEDRLYILRTVHKSLNYGHINENVLNVWFPQKERRSNAALQVPICLTSKSASSGTSKGRPYDEWAEFRDGGVRVSIPEVRVEHSGSASQRSPSVDLGSTQEWAPVFASCITFWLVRNVYVADGTLRSDSDDGVPSGFPPPEDFLARRPIDLNPADVITSLEKEGLFFPWHVVESACAALNAGKHVIFTGPPGCGKSKLSSFLAKEATGHNALMATASPAWTAGDLIGRYLPDKHDRGLIFREGFFLRAIDTERGPSRWLIIDEFNRADIDACFGELFSVLAGDSVELPFEKTVDSSTEEERPAEELVRIVPPQKEVATPADYRVSERFRLIGTMNDADRSGLNNLSFALMRRFSIIPVEPPSGKVVLKIINNKISKETNRLELNNNAWDLKLRGTERGKLDYIEPILGSLLVNRIKKQDDEIGFHTCEDKFRGLISERLVGVSSIGDVVRFVGEGLRSGTNKNNLIIQDKIKHRFTNPVHRAKVLTLSYLSLAVVLQIFPQLEALALGTDRSESKLGNAVVHIFSSLHNADDDVASNELPMLRVAKNDESYILQSDQTIGEFLYQNLLTRFPEYGEQWFQERIGEWLPSENEPT